jgi:DNA-binding NarL/FixJ family response regulator
MEEPWRVLVVEDDAVTRCFLEGCIGADPGFELAGGVGSCAEGLARFADAALPVDAMLIDLGLPDGSGLPLIEAAAARRPVCAAIVVSTFGDESSVMAAIEAGAVGYLHKDAGVPDVIAALTTARAGGAPISPGIARRVLERLRGARRTAAGTADAGRPLLSQREIEVLGMIARGFTYAETASRVGISLHTVQAHIKSMYAKLAVHSKNAAVYEATRLGLLAPPPPPPR